MRRLALATVAILLFLYSCSDTSLFLGDYEEPPAVRVATVPSGTILMPGDDIPIRIERGAIAGDETSPDTLVFELLDHDGVVLAEQTTESVDHAVELPSVELPDLPDGIYVVSSRYYDGDELVASDAVTFFICSAEIRISRVTAYPPSLYPGASGLLRVTTSAPPGFDPYLAWYVDGELMSAGFVSSGAAQLEVHSPDTQGIYPVRVELFPFWADDLDLLSLEPPVIYTTEIYVSDTPTLLRTDLTPEPRYLTLYHLSGDFRESGARAEWLPQEELVARPDGEVRLAVDDDIFGYLLDGNSGITIPGATIPSREGSLTPFSIALRIRPTELNGIQRLVSMITGDTERLSLLADPDGRIGVTLSGDGEILWSLVPVLSLDTTESVTVSLEPEEDGVNVTFFAGGQGISTQHYPLFDPDLLVAGDRITVPDEWDLLQGETRLGGGGGFVGIVDEFGIYFRDDDNQPSAHSDVYASVMRARFGDRLIYAEGFETTDVPGELIVAGDVSVTRGQLVIEPGATVGFPDLRFRDEDLVVDAAMQVTGVGIVRFSRIDTGGEIARVPVTEADARFARVILRFTQGGSRLVMTFGDEATNIRLPEADNFVGLQLELIAPEDPATRLLLRDILAYSDRPRIPDTVLQPDPVTAVE